MGAANLTVEDVSPERLRESLILQLGKYDRRPFIKQLATLLACTPSLAAIKQFSEKHPDRWAQAVAIMAKLSGFQTEEVVRHVFDVQDMSDAEILARIAKLPPAPGRQGDALARLPVTIEGEANHG